MKVQQIGVCSVLAILSALGACSSTTTPNAPGGAGGGTSGSATTAGASNTSGTGGTSAGTGGTPAASCNNVTACGGNAVGTWTASSSCIKVTGQLDIAEAGLDPRSCTAAPMTGSLTVTGSFTAKPDGTYVDDTVTTGTAHVDMVAGCLMISGTGINCMGAGSYVKSAGWGPTTCTTKPDGGCSCDSMVNFKGGLGLPSSSPAKDGNYTAMSNTLSLTTDAANANYAYCTSGSTLTLSPQSTKASTLTGSVVFSSGSTGTGGAGGGGGTSAGGTSSGGSAGAGGSAGMGGSGGMGTHTDGPCDIYKTGGTPCAAAYSMVRALSKTYTGPLFQVRTGSSAMNTGMGGVTKDIGQTADGYQDSATLEMLCPSTTICTVSLLYDQSGNGNNLPVAKAGLTNGGAQAGKDDFESRTPKGGVTAGGHKVYPLYMAQYEGYRLQAVGKGMPLKAAANGIYEVADGTHSGGACCWDFGNVTTNPKTYGTMNTVFFGEAGWGNGAGTAPWFMADFEAGVWAGGSKLGDPGWGGLTDPHPKNTADPSMAGVDFAMGILKTQSSGWSLRAANVKTATDLTTAYEGALPKAMDNLGGIVLGVGGDNSNNSFGTFFEGAIVAGFPTKEIDLAVLNNVKAVGYTK